MPGPESRCYYRSASCSLGRQPSHLLPLSSERCGNPSQPPRPSGRPDEKSVIGGRGGIIKPCTLWTPGCCLRPVLDATNLLIYAVFISPEVRRYTAYVWSAVGPPHCPTYMWPRLLPLAGLCEPTARRLEWALDRCPFALLCFALALGILPLHLLSN